MKLSFLILTIYFALTFASPVSIIKSSSIIDSLSQLLYNHLTPIFQNTLEQLIQLVWNFGENLSQNLPHRSIRSNPVKPAPWISQFFGELNDISTQWNTHVTNFFTGIPTIFETTGRSLLSFPMIKDNLHKTVEKLLQQLKILFFNNINQLLMSMMNEVSSIDQQGEIDRNGLVNTLQLQVSGVFEKTKEQLSRSIDDSIDFILMYFNEFKDRVLG